MIKANRCIDFDPYIILAMNKSLHADEMAVLTIWVVAGQPKSKTLAFFPFIFSLLKQ